MPTLKILSLLLLSTLFIAPLAAKENELTVYTYSSLQGKGSLCELLQKEWELLGKKVKFVSFSTSQETLNQVLLEKNKTKADLILGIDQQGLVKAKISGHFLVNDLSKILPLADKAIPREGLQSGFVPFDFGYLAFVYDKTKVKPTSPTSFLEFITEQKAKRMILIDPRTSQLGFSFLAWTEALWKSSEWEKNLSKLASITKLWSPGWSAAYSLFLKGEGDYVLSYTTSPAYHIEKEKKTQYQTVTFNEGHFMQVESAGIVRYSGRKELAEEFLKLLVSKHVQEKIPQVQWMYPVLPGLKLPASFEKLQVVKPIKAPLWVDESTQNAWLAAWTNHITASR